MRNFLLSGLLGVCAGAFAPVIYGSSPAPLPPERWNNASLLREYRAHEADLRTEAYHELWNTRGVRQAEEEKMLPAKARTLVGQFASGAKALRLRITCQTEDPETCCTEAQTMGESGSWQNSGWTGGLPASHIVRNGKAFYDPQNMRPYEQGHAFSTPLWEIPREGAKETELFAFNVDRRAWLPQGKISWTETPPEKKACDL